MESPETVSVHVIQSTAQKAIEEGRLDDAFSLLVRHKKEVAQSPELLSMLAVILILTKRYDEAQAFLIDALSAHPYDADLLFNLGYIHEIKGQWRTALSLYRLAHKTVQSGEAGDIAAAVDRARLQLHSAGPVAKKISLVYNSHSGSNTIALFKLMPSHIRERYEVQLVRFTGGFRHQLEILDSDLVVTTHGNQCLDPDQLQLDLWHGFPLKAIGLMDKQENHALVKQYHMKHTNKIASYSTLFTVLLNSTLGKTINDYVVTGAPRNDFLFCASGRDNLARVLGIALDGRKVVMFTPTFRRRPNDVVDGEATWAILETLGFGDKRLHRFLEEQNILLILKLHPWEEAYVTARMGEMGSVRLLRDQDLDLHQVDFYEVLNAVDALITDYSSIYFDFLLLDRPVLFAAPDVDEYRSRRGFMLEPYDLWTPGPKIHSSTQLECELTRCLTDANYYRAERNWVTSVVHQFKDGHSSERVWRVIEEMLGQSPA